MLPKEVVIKTKQYTRSYRGANVNHIVKFIERVSLDLFGKLPSANEFSQVIIEKVMQKYDIKGGIDLHVAVINDVMRVVVNLPVRLSSMQFENIKKIVQNGRDVCINATTSTNHTTIKACTNISNKRSAKQLLANMKEVLKDNKWVELYRDLECGNTCELILMLLEYAENLIGLDKHKYGELSAMVYALTNKYLLEGMKNNSHILLRPDLTRTYSTKDCEHIIPFIDVVVYSDLCFLEENQYHMYRSTLKKMISNFILDLHMDNFFDDEKDRHKKYAFFTFGTKDHQRSQKLMDMKANQLTLNNIKKAQEGAFCMLKKYRGMVR